MSAVLRNGISGKWLRMSSEEQGALRRLEAKHGRDAAAKILGTSTVTLERLWSGAWCSRRTVERVRERLSF